VTASHPDAGLDALVLDARAGSGAAFTDLWRRLSPVVAGYVRGRGVRDAEDVTSDVFLAAFRGLAVGPGHHEIVMEYSPRGWLSLALVSLLGTLAAAVIAVVGLRRERRAA